MSQSDDLDKRLAEINQIFHQSGQENFVKLNNLVEDIYLRNSINARYIQFCNNNNYKHKKKICVLLMKFDIRNGLTWTTCLNQSLKVLPDIQTLKVRYRVFRFIYSGSSFSQIIYTKSILVILGSLVELYFIAVFKLTLVYQTTTRTIST